jgi:hypothetical protein
MSVSIMMEGFVVMALTRQANPDKKRTDFIVRNIALKFLKKIHPATSRRGFLCIMTQMLFSRR